MKKNKQILMLVGIVVFSCALIISAHNHTEPLITERQEKVLNERIERIFPSMTNTCELKENELYKVFEDDSLLGYAVITEAYGYQSHIRIIVGFEKPLEIKDVYVLDEGETPGLGSRVSEDNFRQQFSGVQKENLALKDEGGQIDAISGATASSEAVTEAVKKAYGVIDEIE